ncbi:MAG: PilZ domain-containing protein [Myxococcota bacterium]
MLIPVGEAVALPVTVVVLGPEPEVWQGTLTRLDVDTLRIRVTDAGISVGTRIIVTAPDRTKLPGRVLAVDGGEWVVSRDGAHPTDDRSAPRIAAPITLRWRLADRGAPRWIRGGADPGAFVRFCGPADLSLSGVRFGWIGDPPTLGASILVELALDDLGAHRAIGAVRRVEPVGEELLVAVEFVDVPEATFDALSDFTLRNL